MVDFSRAEGSKNHRAAFLRETSNVISYEESLKEQYNNIWEKLEIIRKERAAIIEDTIQLLKNNKVKLEKQLGRCNNEELVSELNSVKMTLPYTEREVIEINALKIGNRYDLICQYGEELQRIYNSILAFKVPEIDVEEEVEFSIEPEKKEEQPETQEEFERVVAIKTPSRELVRSLNEYKKSHQPDIIEDDELIGDDEELLNTDELSSISDEIAFITEDLRDETDEESYIPYSIDDSVSLQDVAKHVYGNDDSWIKVYEYDDNAIVIDEISRQTGDSIEHIASTPGVLKNVTIKFPTSLNKQEENTRRVS